MSNPWNLTERQEQILSALVNNGGVSKRAADVVGGSVKNVLDTLYRARKTMQAKTPFEALLEWDRWERKQ